MSTVSDTIKHLQENFSPDDHICNIIWSSEDVIDWANDNQEVQITQAEADKILDHMERKHDAEFGVNWYTIDNEVDDLIADKEAAENGAA